MKNEELVKKHFKKVARDFDGIYDNRGSVIKKTINKVFRKAMRERVALTLQECENDHKKILDIGCGSGRVSLPLAEKGMSVVGIDYSSEMIDLAKDYLKKYEESLGIKLNIEFLCSDFMNNFESNNLFDITLALGVLDYIKDPLPFLKKMLSFTKEEIIISFPAKYSLQTLIRKFWLYTKKCPVYFYTKRELSSIYSSLELADYEIIKITSGYLVKGYVSR
jgi:2-polyprenyl-3-methyl-5-hydroxy-6-metoxy-1,4-benzoquinol methylase